MPNLKPTEIILLLLVVIILFGAKRLPDAARGLGRSLRIFKAETKGLMDDDSVDSSKTTVQQMPPASLPPVDVTPPTQATQPVQTAAPQPVQTVTPQPEAQPGATPEH